MSYDSRVDTQAHIEAVRQKLGLVIDELADRADKHDASKLESPEREMFDEFTPRLREMDYGSEEYKEALEAMGGALEHHYAHNSHHPEHFPNGVAGMSLLDVIEMLCDWKAASERMKKRPGFPAAPGRVEAPTYDDNFVRSIELNQKRWGFSDELRSILENTARELGFV